MSRKRRDSSSGGFFPFSDSWIKFQADKIDNLSEKDRRTHKTVEEKQQWMIDILTKRREEEGNKCKLRQITKEFNEIKDLLLEKINKYKQIERESFDKDNTYEADMLMMKSIKKLLEKI